MKKRSWFSLFSTPQSIHVVSGKHQALKIYLIERARHSLITETKHFCIGGSKRALVAQIISLAWPSDGVPSVPHISTTLPWTLNPLS